MREISKKISKKKKNTYIYFCVRFAKLSSSSKILIKIQNQYKNIFLI